jgi:UDP-N-acetylmuramoyl-L-alanyl-D-glutamate--2,6-diaminopimelate ligase
MKLGELAGILKNASAPSPNRDVEVSDIAHDSRKVKPGSLFVAVRGFHSDGHRFISQAVQRGAGAVVAEREDEAAAAAGIPQIIVKDTRESLALLSAAFFGRPSERLSLIGVTGTNGKTTTTYLVKSIIEAAGQTAGLIGTIDYRIGNKIYPAPNTTPESLELQRLLDEMAGRGAAYCVMEVSSHALELGRTLGCTFRTAAFTNLTQDHLDFHETMDAYFHAKLRLFAELAGGQRAVVNLDDPRAAEIIRHTKAEVITTGMTGRSAVHPAGAIRHDLRGLAFEAATPLGTIQIKSPLVGRHNIHNILTAVGIAVTLGFSKDEIAHGIGGMKAVPGRLEKIDEGQSFGVVVDYAHTEDALVRLLEAARELTANRIITVFGCGGDRDRTKRPKMGAAALQGSDVVIVTSDNPRTESPLHIIKEIEAGMKQATTKGFSDARVSRQTEPVPYHVVPDRQQAIASAIAMARPGDVVVLAGKGHEDYQIIGDTKFHFDDRETAREEIGKRQKADI